MDKLKEEFAEVSKHELHPEMTEKNFEIYFGEIHPSDKEISEQGSISFLYTLMRMTRRSPFDTIWKAMLNNARLAKRILVCR